MKDFCDKIEFFDVINRLYIAGRGHITVIRNTDLLPIDTECVILHDGGKELRIVGIECLSTLMTDLHPKPEWGLVTNEETKGDTIAVRFGKNSKVELKRKDRMDLPEDMRYYTSFAQSHKLWSLGLDPNTADMCYKSMDGDPFDHIARPYSEHTKYKSIIYYDVVPCWSVGKLMHLMSHLNEPNLLVELFKWGNMWRCDCVQGDDDGDFEYSEDIQSILTENIVQSAFEMTAWLLETKLLKQSSK